MHHPAAAPHAPANRPAIDIREFVNPVLAHVALKQREYRASQMLLQDIHSSISFVTGGDGNECSAAPLRTAQPAVVIWGILK
ncbi:hypothetical protein Bxe_A3586 [Paraburkholderia xenovorans LB400]|uniref:Uncharacterized protein n=1 Tax=Paraburkholderia xenovorans (strain LB400) TaxID=266265 RepID=Q143T6_PARXL|nr:hypothetical protein Bxe_A3586 [Paraburkholderia xenovorans LB400]